MFKRSLFVAVFSLVLGLAGSVRAEEAAKAPAAPAGECPHMKAMHEAQAQGKGGECPHMKDGKPCDCPRCKAAMAAKAGKAGKPGKMEKPAGKKGAKASPEGESKPAKE